MRLNDQQLGRPQGLYKDTKANIEAIEIPIVGMIAFATDTDEIGIYSQSDAAWIWGQPGSGTSINETFIDADRNGFLNPLKQETSISFDGTSVFTLAIDAGPSWSYYNAGIKYTISENKEVDLLDVEDPLVDGRLYYIYITGTEGELSASIDPWNLVDDGRIPVATILWNNTATPKYWMAEERHTVLIDRRFHAEHHKTEGSEIATFPSLSDYIVEPATNYDTDDGKTFKISQAVMYDEDIIVTNAELSDPDGTNADYVIFYRTDADSWTWKASAMPYPYNTGTNIIQWDNAGALTDGTEGTGSNQRYYNSYLLVTNFYGAARWVIIPGQHQYTSLVLAQEENPGSLVLTGLPIAESVFAYRLTWHTKNFTSKGHAVLASVPKQINFATLTIAGTATEHNTLTGLQGGTGGEYYHVQKGATTGDFTRYNSVTGTWEVATEPLQLQGLVLTPALASLVDAEGAIYYNSATKSVMVCTDI